MLNNVSVICSISFGHLMNKQLVKFFKIKKKTTTSIVGLCKFFDYCFVFTKCLKEALIMKCEDE